MEHQTARTNIAAGDILAGKYRVERILGMGGMGVVLAATHLDLREERAIKLVRPDLSHPHIVERFLREGRAVVKLRSEHIAQVYDTGRLDCGAPFIVMELLHGQDLAELLKKRGTLSIQEAVGHVMQACDALCEAHARGIVHRDLKPANLFLTHRADGSPCIKVLDFGVSKVIAQQGEGEVTELEMTNNGDIMGSPLYMAPEQMRAAREVDARADIWALGAILYKLLTGKAPFQRATAPEIFVAVLGHDIAPLPSSLRPRVPGGLDAVIMRCLSRDPAARFARAADLKAALSPYSDPRDHALEDDSPPAAEDSRSFRYSNSSRPVPRNIDAILLGCIGKDPSRHAARSPRRRTTSDPFLRRVEPRDNAPSAPSIGDVESETWSTGGGTMIMADPPLRNAQAISSIPPAQALNAPILLQAREGTFEETTALAPPRLPSFPSLPSASAAAPSHQLPPAPSDVAGNSMAPWDYVLAPTSPKRKKPLALVGSATVAVFVVIALVMAFTTGAGVAQSTRTEPARPAAGGLLAPADVLAVEPQPGMVPAPAISASAAVGAVGR